MGAPRDAEGNPKLEIMNNEAWQSIDAVKNKQVFFLPDDLFLLNPGLEYPKAVRCMAAKMYPGAVKE